MKYESTFFSANGITEHFYALTSVPGADFPTEAKALLRSYRDLANGTTPVFLRFHVSDVTNQAALLRELVGPAPSIVGQPPAGSGKIAIEAYHLSGNGFSVSRHGGCTELRLKNYRQLFFHAENLAAKGSGPQMKEEFDHAEKLLREQGGTPEKNLQRTWIYCRDIDNNYAGLVQARRDVFRQYGLTENTHYIASTGIEGQSDPPDRLVRMDSFALFGHRDEQIEYMQALDHLSPTHLYGVTFERGTRILYGDRSRYWISGTASIDSAGRIVHPGSVAKQAERMTENVEALLRNHRGGLADLKQAVVYLRDSSDAPVVDAVLKERLSPDTAVLMVKAPVCRPGWLVEMEGVAVNASGNPQFKEFA